jgi:hypothetical protein
MRAAGVEASPGPDLRVLFAEDDVLLRSGMPACSSGLAPMWFG